MVCHLFYLPSFSFQIGIPNAQGPSGSYKYKVFEFGLEKIQKAHSWWAFVCSEGVHKREIWIVVCGGDLKMALRKQSKVGSSKKPTTISKVGFGERVQIYLYEY